MASATMENRYHHHRIAEREDRRVVGDAHERERNGGHEVDGVHARDGSETGLVVGVRGPRDEEGGERFATRLTERRDVVGERRTRIEEERAEDGDSNPENAEDGTERHRPREEPSEGDDGDEGDNSTVGHRQRGRHLVDTGEGKDDDEDGKRGYEADEYRPHVTQIETHLLFNIVGVA